MHQDLLDLGSVSVILGGAHANVAHSATEDRDVSVLGDGVHPLDTHELRNAVPPLRRDTHGGGRHSIADERLLTSG